MLLVEDEPAIRTVVRRTLAGTAYDLLVARNGDQARQHRGVIDLPQADVVMSRMNRFEPGELIGAAHPETTVLFVSDDSRDSAALRRWPGLSAEAVHVGRAARQDQGGPASPVSHRDSGSPW